MKNVTRRQFLKWTAIGVGSLAGGSVLNACKPAATTASAVPPAPARTRAAPGATAAPVSEGTASVGATLPASAPTAASYPDLVVVRGGEPDALVRQALAALGGIERFVRPGNDVVIKPNICVAYHTFEYAATTNPWVVATLVALCREAGARRVRVMDSPFGGTPEEAYAKSGIQEQVHAAGGEMETMAGFKFVGTKIPDGQDLRKVDIYDGILKADVLIDVPIAKHHGLAKLTLGMKNLMGVIRDRQAIHANMGQRLADLASRVRPALTVVDAVRILTANGPTGGDLNDVKKLDTVIASADIVAADSYGATLFGLRPDDLDYVRAGAAMGLGRSDLASLKIQEVAVGG